MTKIKPRTTPETPRHTTDIDLEEHDCAYDKRLDTLADTPGHTTSWSLGRAGRLLSDVHEGGACPPTHVDGSPTIAWSDFVDSTRY